MTKTLSKIIKWSFYALFVAVPLILYPKTSEIFEFNKMVSVYFFTTLICSLWLAKMLVKRKVIFQKTALDIPILTFLGAMSMSSIFSVDPRTSFLGYYSRFNGGLLSLISYSLLYWAYVSNMDKKATLTLLKITFLATLTSSVWAILEHFGRSFSCLIFPDFRVFDNSCWVQDVQTRVYSTFGQPNWLAAWLVALIPLTWYFGIKEKKLHQKTGYFLLFGVFLITLLFTKSRSGILAFVFSFLTFWAFYLASFKQKLKRKLLSLTSLAMIAIVIVLVVGTPWSPNLEQIAKGGQISTSANPKTNSGPALETGGTESGTIRKIVWHGALNIWKAHPVLGTGLETFAFSYYNFKPLEHNLTSEWDYLYNKAHNEYLNFMATTGTLGTLSYLTLIVVAVLVLFKLTKGRLFNIAIVSGYISILTTNFFGFSTVLINTLFFLLPAFALGVQKRDKSSNPNKQLGSGQKISLVLLTVIFFVFVGKIISYWKADVAYAYGQGLNYSGSYLEAANILEKLVGSNSNEPNFIDELSEANSNIAVFYSDQGQMALAENHATKAYAGIKQVLQLSPASVTLKRKAASRLISMSAIDQSYLSVAKDILLSAVKLAPTDAKLRYNLSLAYLRTGDYETALKVIKETIELKPNYELARYALALMLIDLGQNDEAANELEYILEKINPDNVEVQRALNELE